MLILNNLRPRLHGSGQIFERMKFVPGRLFTWICANSVAVVFTRIHAKFTPVVAFDFRP